MTLFGYYGSGVDYVGHKVAEGLGLPFHQQAFSSEAIEAGQAAVDEQGAVLAQVFAVMGGAYGGFDGRDVATTQRQKYELVMDNNRQVWKSADEGGVILGRNGAIILAERPNTLHVLLTGAVEDRVERAAKDERDQPRPGRDGDRAHEDQVRADISRVTVRLGPAVLRTATTWCSTPQPDPRQRGPGHPRRDARAMNAATTGR